MKEELFANTRERVFATLEAEAASHSVKTVRGVVVDAGREAAGYDLILVDEIGVVVVAVPIWPDHEVRGSSRGTWWTARSPGNPAVGFSNPLRENARAVSVLTEALAACGRRLPPGSVTSLVVLEAGDTSALRLTDEERFGVVGPSGIGAALRARRDYRSGSDVFEQHEVAEMISLLRLLDRTESRSVLEPVEEPPRRTGLFRRRGRAQVQVADAALGVAPIAPRLTGDRYPGLEASRTRRSAFPAVVLLLLLTGIGFWLFGYGGLAAVSTAADGLLSGLGRSGQEAVPPPPGSDVGNVEQATAALRDLMPDVYATAVDPGRPEVVRVERYTSYTWHYVPVADGRAGTEQWVTFTLDDEGQLRGVTSSKGVAE